MLGRHGTTKTVEHAPSCLVAAAQVLLKLFGTQPRGVRRDKVSRPEPVPDRPVGVLQDGSHRWRYIEAAGLALVRKTPPAPPKPPTATFATDHPVRPPTLHHILNTSPLIRKTLAKSGPGLGKRMAMHRCSLGEGGTGANGIIFLT